MLKHVLPILSKIFEAYFPWEGKVKSDAQSVRQRSEKALFALLKDFDICPTLLTKSTCFLLFNQIIEANSLQKLLNST
jgi:hypothetical protein